MSQAGRAASRVRSGRALLMLGTVSLGLTACSSPVAGTTGATPPGEVVVSSAAPSSAPQPAEGSPSAAPQSDTTPTWTFPSVPQDTRTGSELDTPFVVNGLVVVSKEHRITSRYVPAWADEPQGIHPDAYAAFATLSAAARAEGLTLTIRSGYRSYAAQQDSFERALQTYDEATARRYFAEPGASEHQTGLSLDAWDGTNRGSAFTATPEAAWLGEHASEFGFIIRYPEGKTDITGYAYESWHLRWVGTEVSSAFADDPSLTLEEYLGLA